MFSGIIEAVGRVKAVAPAGSGMQADIATGYADLIPGESVAVNGVCLTVTEDDAGAGAVRFFMSAETLSRTNLDALAAGKLVNIERAVQASTRLSGHMVQGHVDGTASIVAITPDADTHIVEIELPAGLARYCVEKGSIALNGISLTINELAQQPDGAARISITIIPHTWQHTSLQQARPGDEINVEVDVIAKYVERLCLPYLTQ